MSSMRVVFMGTPDFSVPILKGIIDAQHDVPMVVTGPDRRQGRGQKVRFSPVKKTAVALGLPVCQPASVAEPGFYRQLCGVEPDVVVVVAFGQKIPPEILRMPPHGCINVHASLLPEYRGAAPINRAIMDGKKETGVTMMRMDEGWDTGDIILQDVVAIGKRETAGELHDRLAQLGSDLLLRALTLLEKGKVCYQPQDGDGATYAPKLEKSDGVIDWSQPAERLDCLIRGVTPWPGAYTFYQNRMLRIWSARPSESGVQPGVNEPPPGTVIDTGASGFTVRTGAGGSLLIEEVQPENRSRMSGADFINGYGLRTGDVFTQGD